MKKVFLDLESKPQHSLTDIFNDGVKANANIKDPEKIKANIEAKKAGSRKAMSVDPDYAEIFCIGWKELDKKAELIDLDEFINRLKGDITFITFNGKAFDVPLIIKKGIKQGKEMPYKALHELTKRYSNGEVYTGADKKTGILKHIDLMELIGEFGNYKSLDKYLQIYIGIKKEDIDFDTCTDEELEDHCREDLLSTELLYKKFKWLS